MNLISATQTQLEFQLSTGEKHVLAALLGRYPCIPPAHQRLSQSSALPDQEASQRMLDEALAEQRQENRQRLQALLADDRRLKEVEGGWRLRLSPSEVEWVLQVLNDIRVGSWVRLGSPEERLRKLDEMSARHWWAMEMSGHFQMEFLEALKNEA